jgi:hypothetical protein
MAKVSKKALMEQITAATNSDIGYAVISKTEADVLAAEGKIEINLTAGPDAQGNVQVRAISPVVAEQTPEKMQFEIVSGLPIPASTRGGGGSREEIYPFSKLQVGESFFIPATAAKPNPAETFASTVTSAQRRFAEKTGNTKTNRVGKVVPEIKLTRRFSLRAVKAGQTYAGSTFVEQADGARVFRIA